MDVVGNLPWMTAGAGALVTAGVWHWHRSLSRAISGDRPAPARLLEYPSVTMVRPVRGLDVGAEENFRAALDNGYPGNVETLFVFDDDDDPALPVARQVVAEHYAEGRPGRAHVIVAGPPPPGRTGKLNAMMLGVARASGTLIGFGDSDTRPDRAVLRGVVEALMGNPTAGAAFAPVLVDQPPTYAGDALYAVMQNAMYSPLAAHAAGPSRTLPFIMGQLMVFRREALLAIGGVECAQGQLVDDMAIGRCVHQAGYTNVMSRAPLHIATGGMTLRQFIPVFRRWMLFSRNGLPLSFTWRHWVNATSFFLALALMVLGLATGGLLAALPAMAALAAVNLSFLALHRQYGGAPFPARLWWAGWGVYLVSPWVLGANLLQRRVDWRGRSYELDREAALAARPPALVVAADGGFDDDDDDGDLDGLDWPRPAVEPAQLN